jgi:prevent-host-death family protein
MAAGEFKAKCLAVMAEVHASGEPVLITKRGKPMARIVSSQEDAPKLAPESIFGCLSGLITHPDDIGDLVEPIIPLEEWDHLKDDFLEDLSK